MLSDIGFPCSDDVDCAADAGVVLRDDICGCSGGAGTGELVGSFSFCEDSTGVTGLGRSRRRRFGGLEVISGEGVAGGVRGNLGRGKSL